LPTTFVSVSSDPEAMASTPRLVALGHHHPTFLGKELGLSEISAPERYIALINYD